MRAESSTSISNFKESYVDTLPNTGERVRIISAPKYFALLIGQTGQVGERGKSGETVAVSIAVGQHVYFTKEELELVV